jgi:hypothetical protein
VLDVKAVRWSGTTADGRNVGGTLEPWLTSGSPDVKKRFKAYQDAFRKGLAAFWTEIDDCDDDCVCEKDVNQKEPKWSPANPRERKFRQPYPEPGYKPFFIHGTYKLQWKSYTGTCQPNPDEELEDDVLLGLLLEGEIVTLDTELTADS